MPDSSPFIRVRNLRKRYGRRLFKSGFQALAGVDLEVQGGMVFGLLGPNGAGKTTLVKVLLGLCRGWEGEAEVFGRRAGQAPPRSRIGYLPEAHRLPGYLTGRQVMELFGRLCGRDKGFLRKRIPQLLDTVGMHDSADRKVREYSKGMQQRIGLAQAMIHEPDLLILDEPTDGVDPVGRAAIRDVVERLKQKGTTIFINSHLLMEVELICDRVVIMDKGTILREGTIEELTPATGLIEFEIDPVPEDLAGLLAGVVQGFEAREGGFQITASTSESNAAIDCLRARGITIKSVSARRFNLEETFIDLVRGASSDVQSKAAQ